MSNDSNDWLASIDLNAVKPAGPRKTARAKKPRRRIVYGEPARLAPVIPSWAQGRGPDTQRAVTAVAGQFVPTDELCTAQFTYEEACEVLRLVADTPLTHLTPRLIAVLKAAIAPYEFKRAAEAHTAAEAAKTRELHKVVHKAFSLITLKDD